MAKRIKMDRNIPLHIRRRNMMKQLFKALIIVVGLVFLFIMLARWMAPGLDGNSIISQDVDRGSIEVTVNASGRVVPLSEEIIVSPIHSRILEVYKNPGDHLEEGDPILKLELAAIETELRQKQDELLIRKARLEQTRLNLQSTLSEMGMQLQIKELYLNQLEVELSHEKYLIGIGASTSHKVRQSELQYEVSRLETEQLRLQLDNHRTNAASEIMVQELELGIFQKSLAETNRLLNNARILSPQNAILTYVNRQIGAQVSAGTQIAIVSDLSRFKVEAQMAGSHANRLSAGARAKVKVGPDYLQGTVVNITPSVQDGTVHFTVMLTDPEHSRLRSGLRVDVHVMHGISDNVLRLPNAPFYIGKGRYDLWVVSDNDALKREVYLGESSFEYVEVVSGLAEGDRVITSDMSRYEHRESVRIKPR